MKLKYYLRGLGIGIMVTAVVCGLGSTNASEPISDSEVIARAKELGMVEGTVLSKQDQVVSDANENNQNEIQATAAETIKETEVAVETAFEESKNETKEDLTATSKEIKEESKEATKTESKESKKSDAKEESKEATKTESKETKKPDAKEESKEAVKKESKPATKEESKEANKTESKPATKEESKESTQTEKNEEPAKQPTGEKVKIVIPGGSGSYTVAKALKDAGLVADADAYDKYLCANGYDRRICSGTFEVPTGASDEMIAKIITKQQ